MYGRLYTKYEFSIDEVDTYAQIKDNSVFSRGNEVIIPASGETAEDIARASTVEKPGVLLGGDLNIVHPGKEIISQFLALTLSSGNPQKDLASKAQGKSVVHIHNSDIEGVKILFPQISEQEKIVSLFRNLDNLITLHQRKFIHVILCGKFNKNYINIKNTYVWEQRKLLSCIQKVTDFRGRTPKKLGMDWSDSGYLALSALNVKDGYIDFSQDVHYGDQALYDKWMSGNELHKGQVLFTTEAPMGNVAQVPDDKQYILSQRTIAFDVKEDIITENFLATLLRSPTIFSTLTSLSSGGTAKGVSQKSLSGVDIQIPIDLKEQSFLATYFHNIDELITLHQRKLYLIKQRGSYVKRY